MKWLKNYHWFQQNQTDKCFNADILIHQSKHQYIHVNLLSIQQQNKLVSLLDETKLYFKSNIWNEHLWIKTQEWEKASQSA